MHTIDDRYVRLLQALETVGKLTQQGDTEAIERLLAQPVSTTRFDAPTIGTLRHARDSILAIRRALLALLETAAADGPTPNLATTREPSDESTTVGHGAIDCAEAWRRANLRLLDHGGTSVLLHVEEFAEGYRAIPVLVEIPEAPSTPTLETPTTLVIDKTTGAVTYWPQLSLDVLAQQYRRYRRGEPMTFDVLRA
jgi:hypothetical protein